MKNKDSKEIHADKMIMYKKYNHMQNNVDEKAKDKFRTKPYGIGVVKNETKEKASDTR